MTRIFLVGLLLITMINTSIAQKKDEKVKVDILLDDPSAYNQLVLSGGLGYFQRQASPITGLLLAGSYDVNEQLNTDARFYFGLFGGNSNANQFEFQVGGNYFFHQVNQRNKKSKVSLGVFWDAEHVLNIKLTKQHRYGARAGINYFNATYGDFDFNAGPPAQENSQISSAYLTGQGATSVYVGGVFEIRQYAVLDVEKYGEKTHALKHQLYVDVVFGAGVNGTYSTEPANELETESIGFRIGYGWSKSRGLDKLGYGLRVELGKMPGIALTEGATFTKSFYYGFGGTVDFGLM